MRKKFKGLSPAFRFHSTCTHVHVYMEAFRGSALTSNQQEVRDVRLGQDWANPMKEYLEAPTRTTLGVHYHQVVPLRRKLPRNHAATVWNEKSTTDRYLTVATIR